MSYSVRAVETVDTICVACDVPYQLIWAFSRKSDTKLQSIIINTVDSIVDQDGKMNLWGMNCFFYISCINPSGACDII